MLSPLNVLPLHLACQLLISQNDSTLMNVGLDTSLPKLVTEIPAGYTLFPDIRVAYKYYKSSITWNAARRYCVGDGGNLAVIDSFEKIEHVKSVNYGGTNAWVGIHRLFDTEWTDIKNGVPALAIPWRSASYETEVSRQCIGLVISGDVGSFAAKCTEKLSFICEVPIFKD